MDAIAGQETLEGLREAAAGCTMCPLHGPANRTVFGEGPSNAKLMMVGEQPGDKEDLAGRPFVGPAGQLFDRALQDAGIEREGVYLTNAVKHFKFELRGRRRIHQKPAPAEIKACQPWLDRELELVSPKLVVALGATAARALFRKVVTIGKTRGRPVELPEGRTGYVTVHPSYLLRLPDERAQQVEYARFVEDLQAVKKLAEEGASAGQASLL